MVDPFHWLMGTRLQVPTKLVPADVVFGVLAVLVLLPAFQGGLRRRSAWRRSGIRAAVACGGALVGLLATRDRRGFANAVAGLGVEDDRVPAATSGRPTQEDLVD